MDYPQIIQGGMGIAVSSWRLARAVSQAGGLGVVSGTGLSFVLPARLNDGDPGGHIRAALEHFPDANVARAILDRYYIPGGKTANAPYKRPPMYTLHPPTHLDQLTVAANFVEVWLAKQGHAGAVGINLLEKVQLPTLASLYGAMLAGVDVVIMGAGIPMQVPGILDTFAGHGASAYRVDVAGAGKADDYAIPFDPAALFPRLAERVGPLARPQFYPVVSSLTLARALVKRASGAVNGFVVELPTAGGHNAPPRGDYALNERGEPVYTQRDDVDPAAFAALGLPFWLAGGYGSPAGLRAALDAGAVGVQVGTAFAYCAESGMDPALTAPVVAEVLAGAPPDVLTSARVSPTGFPFKVVGVPGTASEPDVYAARERVCDMGYLRTAVVMADGGVNYRCAAGPVGGFVKKGGDPAETAGRVCLCNQLAAAAGMPQVRAGGYVEPPIVTSGDDLPNIAQFVPAGQSSYTAADVVTRILTGAAG